MTITEAARDTQTKPETIRRLCEQGVIPAGKLGRKWLINRAKFYGMLDGDEGAQSGDTVGYTDSTTGAEAAA